MKAADYICGGNTFAYGGGYIALHVDAPDIPETISVDSDTFLRKSSFHVSLVCVTNIIEKCGAKEQDVLDAFCEFTSAHDVSFKGYTNMFRHARKGEKKSVVALCEVSNIEGLYKHLSESIGADLPPQPTHVTLYTLQPDAGIGLNSRDEMEERSVVIDAPEGVVLSGA